MFHAKTSSVLGGGHEAMARLPLTTITFLGMGNTHAQRGSFAALVAAGDAKDEDWFQALHKSSWLHSLSNILRGAVAISRHLAAGDPVLVHCSDGWDRTPQLVSTAQILMDPFYRTIDGLMVLVEKDWCSFGHQFASRTGFAGSTAAESNAGEKLISPIFLQWLDALWQIMQQFPHSFEYNEELLLFLQRCTYDRWWGNMLHDCDADRAAAFAASLAAMP
ncbi:unnamed protein product, partial [Phaeothamnion confervicola]